MSILLSFSQTLLRICDNSCVFSEFVIHCLVPVKINACHSQSGPIQRALKSLSLIDLKQRAMIAQDQISASTAHSLVHRGREQRLQKAFNSYSKMHHVTTEEL